MTKILSTGIALPPYRVEQKLALEFARDQFSPHLKDIEKYLPVFTNSGIESRYFCVPPEWFLSSKTFSEKNKTYIEMASKLGYEAATVCLDRAGIEPDKIDQIIFVSTTGLATPSIDARLINMLKLRADVRRLPIWGLGCVGGVAGLIAAHDYVEANPGSRALVVAVELCGLTFLHGDYSLSNMIASALFGDGAAAVLLSSEGKGPEIIDSDSHTWPDSLDVMGWNFHDEGLQVVFSKAIPAIVKREANKYIVSFLDRNDLALEDIAYYLIHPGGPRVIEAYRKALGLDDNKLNLATEVLGEHGNMSSATILHILDRFLRNGYEKNKLGFMTALGPGFTAESILLRC